MPREFAFAVAPPADLDYLITGNPEVVVRRKDGERLFQTDPKLFEQIKDQDSQFCAEMAMSVLYPPKLVFVRTPAGVWRVVY